MLWSRQDEEIHSSRSNLNYLHRLDRTPIFYITATVKVIKCFFSFFPLILSPNSNDGCFQRYFRLSRTQFEDLLSHVGGQISFGDTNHRHCTSRCRMPVHLSSLSK
ncbi:hypothetical protein XENOCAPTIV_020181 [Xenoophorus captivus]|uniref:Uncharacterized protein n=1 Tax=Xenoophorus captivus TaxID=1517983 RepID=A0ABV0R5K2_9TELE